MQDPVVTVIVTAFVGPYSEQIRVVGEAAKPQFLRLYKQQMTLLDVMIAVGGLTDFAAGNEAVIMRTAEAISNLRCSSQGFDSSGRSVSQRHDAPRRYLVIPQSFFWTDLLILSLT